MNLQIKQINKVSKTRPEINKFYLKFSLHHNRLVPKIIHILCNLRNSNSYVWIVVQTLKDTQYIEPATFVQFLREKLETMIRLLFDF